MSKQNGTLGQELSRSKLSLLACLTAFTIGITGCGKTSETPTEPKTKTETTQSKETPTDLVATVSMKQQLTGVWLGVASMDQSGFQEKLNRMQPAERSVAVAKASSFLSTVMAIDFRQDGTVENDLEIVATNGQVLREGTLGTWAVLESTTDGVLVETSEKLADGTVSKSQKRYQFSTNSNEFAMPVEVDEELKPFNAQMIFQRQSPNPTNVAEGNFGTQTK
ncbi:MAG: hypothetical protein AB8B55_17885 [Mariniblastus sp.]